MLNSIKDTTKHVYWDSRERVYVALMSEVPMCRAEGSTPGEAIANVERAYAQDLYLLSAQSAPANSPIRSPFMATH